MLVIDDHLVVAEGVARVICSEYEIMAIVADGDRMASAAIALRPDLIVADIEMPGMGGIAALGELRESGCDIPVVFLTMHHEPALARAALAAGAQGVVLKTAPSTSLLRALEKALSGSTYLSPALAGGKTEELTPPELSRRQQQILQLIAEGLRSRDIAGRLGLSVRTIEAHRQALMRSFEARNGIELIRLASRMGIIRSRE